MIKKPVEPDWAIEPALDGLDMLLYEQPKENEENNTAETNEKTEVTEETAEPVLLIAGDSENSRACAKLAFQCGFAVDIIHLGEEEFDENFFPMARNVIRLDSFDNLTSKCDIGSQHYICIFMDNPADCELALLESMKSNARYIGLAGSKKKEIFSALSAKGEPDAELAAIAAPMGLNIDPSTPEQMAVAVTAELLAAKAGKLKRLLHGKP